MNKRRMNNEIERENEETGRRKREEIKRSTAENFRCAVVATLDVRVHGVAFEDGAVEIDDLHSRETAVEEDVLWFEIRVDDLHFRHQI